MSKQNYQTPKTGEPPVTDQRKGRRELDALQKQIEQFRIDAQRFFAGDLPLPPEEQRDRISTQIRKLRSDQSRSVAETFRLGSLESRFNSQNELFKRRLREREEGGQRRPAVAPPPPDPSQGVLVGRSGDPNAAEVLYKGLFLERGARSPSMDLERFRSYLSRQTDAIRAKTGCDDIHFRVAVEDGKPKLKARPVKS